MKAEDAEVLRIHIENLRDRVALLEKIVSSLATKDDVNDIAESVQIVVQFIQSSSGLYKFVLWLGALSAALSAIAFGIKELIKGHITLLSQTVYRLPAR